MFAPISSHEWAHGLQAARHPRAIVVLAWLSPACCCCRHASAQIYAWRDAKGTLVLSDRPIDAPTRGLRGAPARRPTGRPRPLERPAVGERLRIARARARSQRHALRPELVRAVIQVESGFNPRATSPEGRDGPDAADAGHRARARRASTRTTRRRTSAAARPTCGSCSIATTATNAWRSRPTTPAPAPSIATAARCRRIARRATTSGASASRLAAPAPRRR